MTMFIHPAKVWTLFAIAPRLPSPYNNNIFPPLAHVAEYPVYLPPGQGARDLTSSNRL